MTTQVTITSPHVQPGMAVQVTRSRLVNGEWKDDDNAITLSETTAAADYVYDTQRIVISEVQVAEVAAPVPAEPTEEEKAAAKLSEEAVARGNEESAAVASKRGTLSKPSQPTATE